MINFIKNICPYKVLALLLICDIFYWANKILFLYIEGKISIEIIKNIGAGLGFLATFAGVLGSGSKAGSILTNILKKNDEIK